MATKETTKKAQAENTSDQSATTTSTQAAGEVENSKSRTEQEQREVLADLQTKAANALNDLWKELKAQGYKAYNTILLLGIAFEVKKDEAENFYFAPNDLANAQNYRVGSEDEEEEESAVIDEAINGLQPTDSEKPKTRNITTNHGKFRSVHTEKTDNTPFIG